MPADSSAREVILWIHLRGAIDSNFFFPQHSYSWNNVLFTAVFVLVILMSLDGESSVEDHHDGEEVTLVSTNKIPKPKPALLSRPAVERKIVARRMSRLTHPSESCLWKQKCHLRVSVWAPPQSISRSCFVGIFTTAITCTTFPIQWLKSLVILGQGIICSTALCYPVVCFG